MQGAGKILLDELVAVSEEKSTATVKLEFQPALKVGATKTGGKTVPSFRFSSAATSLQVTPEVTQGTIELNLAVEKSWLAATGNEHMPKAIARAELESTVSAKPGVTLGFRANVASDVGKRRDVVVLVTAHAKCCLLYTSDAADE